MKVQHKPFDWKKWMIPIIITVVVVPTLTLAWNYIGKVFASPKKLESIEAAMIQQAETDKKQSETQETLTGLYVEQKSVNDRQDSQIDAQRQITAAQIEALKAIVFEVKKR